MSFYVHFFFAGGHYLEEYPRVASFRVFNKLTRFSFFPTLAICFVRFSTLCPSARSGIPIGNVIAQRNGESRNMAINSAGKKKTRERIFLETVLNEQL